MTLTTAFSRGVWILGLFTALALCAVVAIATAYLLTVETGMHGGAADEAYVLMSGCMMGATLCSVFNLWMHIRSKHAGGSSRWMARGFGMMLLVMAAGVMWVRSLHLGIYDHVSDVGPFFGWFAFSLILVGMVSLNVALFWRRTHRRRRRRSGSRGGWVVDQAEIAAPAAVPAHRPRKRRRA
ncbi:MAG: hypothetical protein U1F52_14475 [Burkholderiales bacterium]